MELSILLSSIFCSKVKSQHTLGWSIPPKEDTYLQDQTATKLLLQHDGVLAHSYLLVTKMSHFGRH